MTPEPIACNLRTLRRRSGLSQEEVAQILGFLSGVPVSRREHSAAIPSLLTAFGYAVLFRDQLAEIFPGLCRTVEAGIEERIAKMEEELQQSDAKGRDAALIARKLEFFWERRNQDLN